METHYRYNGGTIFEDGRFAKHLRKQYESEQKKSEKEINRSFNPRDAYFNSKTYSASSKD